MLLHGIRGCGVGGGGDARGGCLHGRRSVMGMGSYGGVADVVSCCFVTWVDGGLVSFARRVSRACAEVLVRGHVNILLLARV